jgi:hypothetical protein
MECDGKYFSHEILLNIHQTINTAYNRIDDNHRKSQETTKQQMA